MRISDTFAMELSHEGEGTRKALSRIPENLFAWQPHTKSMSMGRLAGHIAEIPKWMVSIVSVDEYVMETENYKPFIPQTSSELIEFFDSGLAAAVEKLATLSDEEMLKTWRMIINGQVAIEMPKVAVVRTMVMNHLYHHRGQLTIYLRLNDIAVPALYGPSADEAPM